MSKNLVIFAVDWGDTIGYSIIDEQSNILLLGNSLDPRIVINQFELAVSYYQNLSLVMERQIGVKSERYQKFIGQLTDLTLLHKTEIYLVSPHIWKNSFVKTIKIRLTRHANDSAKMAIYSQNKLNKE